MLNRLWTIDCSESVGEVVFNDMGVDPITMSPRPITLQPGDRIIANFPDGKCVNVEFLYAQRPIPTGPTARNSFEWPEWIKQWIALEPRRAS